MQIPQDLEKFRGDYSRRLLSRSKRRTRSTRRDEFPRTTGCIALAILRPEAALIVSKQIVEAGDFAAGLPLIEDVAPDAVARGVDDPEVAGSVFAGIEVFDGGASAWKLPVFRSRRWMSW